MKIIFYLTVLQSINIAFSDNPLYSSWIKTTGSKQTFKSVSYTTDVTGVYYSSSSAYVTSQGIPSYKIGPWTANPNQPSGQNWVYQFPLNPSKNNGGGPTLTTSLGQIGAWANGMAIYGPYDGYSYANQDVWHRNALVYEGISFDQCLGHPDGMGNYHNHVVPTREFNLYPCSLEIMLREQ